MHTHTQPPTAYGYSIRLLFFDGAAGQTGSARIVAGSGVQKSRRLVRIGEGVGEFLQSGDSISIVCVCDKERCGGSIGGSIGESDAWKGCIPSCEGGISICEDGISSCTSRAPSMSVCCPVDCITGVV